MGGQGGCERRINDFVKIKRKQNWRGGGRVGWGVGLVCVWGGQGGCIRRIEVFVKIQKKYLFFFFLGGGGGGVWVGVGGVVGRVRVDVNEVLQFL